jgi:hypothetical protein
VFLKNFYTAFELAYAPCEGEFNRAYTDGTALISSVLSKLVGKVGSGPSRSDPVTDGRGAAAADPAVASKKQMVGEAISNPGRLLTSREKKNHSSGRSNMTPGPTLP